MKPYYEQDGVTIYHGDCSELLLQLGGVDAVITDPPYGIGASGGTGKYGRMKWGDTDSGWDAQAPKADLLHSIVSSAKYSIIWGGNYFLLKPSRKFLVWDKGAGFKGRDFAECEFAWCSWDGNAQVYLRDPLAAGDYRNKQHPTQKPVALMAWCISKLPVFPSTILDPFMGSGSTLVAAKKQGVKAVGIDLEERYCEIAANRLFQGVISFEEEVSA